MEEIRNFCILAHIDHGKSTLADRFLELTGTITKDKMRPQFLDMMDLEREKGITIKMQPVRMDYTLNSIPHTLNLIDTPGHVDFSYEVSRSLVAVEGAILLVDATQGIQAQTLANLELAKKQNLTIIPAVNKIDSPQARTEETAEEIAELLNIDKNQIIKISAKTGQNVEELLKKVIDEVKPPSGGQASDALRALILDSKYDQHKGVVAFVRVVDGSVKTGEKIYLLAGQIDGQVKEAGYFKPELRPASGLAAGEIGYIATGIKEPGKVRVGDTITKITNSKFQITNTEALPGYEEPKPMVFAGIYPENTENFELLKVALVKLKLNDAAFSFEPEMKEALGRGYQCGFLGTLHAEIITERLNREFGLRLVISTPQVLYKVINQKDRESLIYSPADWPNSGEIKSILEPWARLEIIAPLTYLGAVSDVLKILEANFIKQEYLGKDKIRFFYEAPLRKIIVGFYENLKSASSGFASMNYEILGYRPADLIKLEILIAGKKEEVFSKIVERKDSRKEGARITLKLKEIMPPQLFAVPLQAAVNGDIIARETISAQRRDVTAPLYGGDYTRKRKLLEKQKKGKKKLAGRADINIPQEVFLKMFKNQ